MWPNRDPGTLAVMAATLQHVSAGRLLLGLGAGARAGTPYAIEQEALGRRLSTGPERRDSVEGAITILRQVWSGAVIPAAGFLRPEPASPIVVAGSGPKMAELAGRAGDGICVPVGPRLAELVGVARQAFVRSGRNPQQLLVTASLASMPDRRQPWANLGIDRLIVYVAHDCLVSHLDNPMLVVTMATERAHGRRNRQVLSVRLAAGA
jgi:alkanesulfonate monooxygenase SsuD/methylene tetrahydromethanopterin reductase-like flavin-dependent oxidoreductase (luciferase family)